MSWVASIYGNGNGNGSGRVVFGEEVKLFLVLVLGVVNYLVSFVVKGRQLLSTL